MWLTITWRHRKCRLREPYIQTSCEQRECVGFRNGKKPVWRECWSRRGAGNKAGQIIPKVWDQWKVLSQWRWKEWGAEMTTCAIWQVGAGRPVQGLLLLRWKTMTLSTTVVVAEVRQSGVIEIFRRSNRTSRDKGWVTQIPVLVLLQISV